MKFQFKARPRIFLQIGKVISLFLIGGIGIHTLIMLLDYLCLGMALNVLN